MSRDKPELLDVLADLEDLMRIVARAPKYPGQKFVPVNFSRPEALKYARAIAKIRSRFISLAAEAPRKNSP